MPGGSTEAPRVLLSKYQIEAFLSGMLQVQAGIEATRRLRGMAGPYRMHKEDFGVHDMLTFQHLPIGTSLLRVDVACQTHAVKMFSEILRFMGLEDGKFLPRVEEVTLIRALHSLLHRFPQLRDEACAQVQKQTRENPHQGACLKAWELLRVLVAAYPPSPSMAAPLSEYLLSESGDEGGNPVLHQAVMAAWGSLDRALRGGGRKVPPSAEEVDLFLGGLRAVTSIQLYDGSEVTMEYDMLSTVTDTLAFLIKKMKLRNCNTFGLFSCRQLEGDVGVGDPLFEHCKQEGGRYLGDVMAEGRAMGGRGFNPCRLLLKKRIFRFTDDVISEPKFVELSYMQVHADYLSGYYPLTPPMAVELAALHMFATLGRWLESYQTQLDWVKQLAVCIPPRMRKQCSDAEWKQNITEIYKGLEDASREDVRIRALYLLLETPPGGSIFFVVKRITPEAARRFPKWMVLAVNKSGVRFVDLKTRALLHTATLPQIEEYADRPDRIYVSMIMDGGLFGIELETTQGAEVCTLLDTFISDALKNGGAEVRALAPPAQGGEASSMSTDSASTQVGGGKRSEIEIEIEMAEVSSREEGEGGSKRRFDPSAYPETTLRGASQREHDGVWGEADRANNATGAEGEGAGGAGPAAEGGESTNGGALRGNGMSVGSNGRSPPPKARSSSKGLFPDMMARKAANGSPPKGKGGWATRGKPGVSNLSPLRSGEDGRGGMVEGLVEDDEDEEEEEGEVEIKKPAPTAQAVGESGNL